MNEDVTAEDIMIFCRATHMAEVIHYLQGTLPTLTHQQGSKVINCEDIRHGHVQQCHEPAGNSTSTKST